MGDMTVMSDAISLGNMMYFELDLFAALVLIIIMDHDPRGMRSGSQRSFQMIIRSLICVLVTDGLGWILEGSRFRGSRELIYACDYMYWLSTLFPAFFSLIYCARTVHIKNINRLCWLGATPIAFGIFMLITNPVKGWVFHVDYGNHYVRGGAFPIVALLPCIHMLLAIIITFWKGIRAPDYRKKDLFMVALYMAIPAVGAYFQFTIYGVLEAWIFMSLSVILCYVYVQNGNTTMDALTGINNRGRFDAYTNYAWMKLSSYEDNLYLIILDINRFKSINDYYGHAEGDQALKTVASVLKQSMSKNRGFLARIGGDEFAIVINNVGEEQIEKLVEDIRLLLEERCESMKLPYKLSLAIGYASTDGVERLALTRLFSKADENMYNDKERAK